MVTESAGLLVGQRAHARQHIRDLLETCAVFAFIVGAIWTPPGPLNILFVLLASISVLVFAARSRWRASEMGLTRPASGAVKILLAGALFCGLIMLLGIALRSAGPGYAVPWIRAAEYGIWAVAQEFILQSVFFLRFEALFGSRHAVFASATAYALAHLPNPVLTGLAILGGILFCELFRRWRNLYPIGLIHTALGLTVAASLPDKWLHHMRVGIGYLMR